MSNNKSKNDKPGGQKFGMYWVYGALALAFLALNIVFAPSSGTSEIKISRLKEMITDHAVKEIVVDIAQKKAKINLYPAKLNEKKYEDAAKSNLGGKRPHYWLEIGDSETFAKKMDQIQADAGIPNDKRIDIDYKAESDWMAIILSWVIPIGLFLLFWMFIMKRVGGGAGGPGGQIFNIGKSKATLFDQNSKVNITFADVAGLKEAKEEVMEVVDFLQKPKKYTALGGKIPKGVLLVGPPGTGKTLLAKAVAGEAKVPFFSISGSDFVEMFVGVGASRVRDLFKQAREKAPCIIFISLVPLDGANTILSARNAKANAP